MNNATPDKNMTDQFYRIFSSGFPVYITSAIANDYAYVIPNGTRSYWLVSYKTKSDYDHWLETLPPLLKELA